MKKTLALAAAILFAYQISNAQTQKGKQTFGLDGFYSHSTNSSGYTYGGGGSSVEQKNMYTNARIGPSYGYFISDGLELGGSLFYSYSRQTYDSYAYPTTNFNETKTNTFGVTAYLRKYVLYQNKIGFRTGPYAGYQFEKNDYTNIPGTGYGTKFTGYSAGANFDLVYYPTERFGLAATIANVSYSHTKSDNNPNNHSSDQNFSARFINSGLGLTFFYTFGN
jgi:hypothetical protein